MNKKLQIDTKVLEDFYAKKIKEAKKDIENYEQILKFLNEAFE